MGYIKLKDVLHILDVVITDDSIKYTGKAIRKRLKELPTEDVEKVVRCKDCIYSTLYCGSYICDNVQTPWFNDEFTIDMGSKDFCSYGERKEGAENG